MVCLACQVLGIVAIILGIPPLLYYGLRVLWDPTIGQLYVDVLGAIPDDVYGKRFWLGAIGGGALGFFAYAMTGGILHELRGFLVGSAAGLLVLLSVVFFPRARTDGYLFQPHLAKLKATAESAAPMAAETVPLLPPQMQVAVVQFKDRQLMLDDEQGSLKPEYRATHPEQATAVLLVDWGNKIETEHRRSETINGPGKRSYTSTHYDIKWRLVGLREHTLLRQGEFQYYGSDSSFSGLELRDYVPELFE